MFNSKRITMIKKQRAVKTMMTTNKFSLILESYIFLRQYLREFDCDRVILPNPGNSYYTIRYYKTLIPLFSFVSFGYF